MRNVFGSLVLLLAAILASCSTTRSLGEDEYLYKKTIVRGMEEGEEVTGRLEKELENSVVHRSNRKWLGLIPLRLWLYNLPGDTVQDKGLGHWIRTRLGEPPAIFNGYEVEASVSEMRRVLRNNGYFQPAIRTERRIEGKKLTMLYLVGIDEPFRIGRISWPGVTDSLTFYIREYSAGSLLDSGQQFTLEILEQERARLMGHLKSTGFFFLLEEHLYFSLDTVSPGGRQVNVSLKLREDMDPDARRMQYIRKITFLHRRQEEPGGPLTDTLVMDSIHHVFSGEPTMDPGMLNNALLLRLDGRYRQEDYRNTLRKLNALGVYQFISVSFRKSEPGRADSLDASIDLTLGLSRSLRAEIQAISRSDDYAGPVVQFSYVNQNINRRAATFRAHLNAGYAVQVSGQRMGTHSLETGTELELDIPGLLLPGVGYRWFRTRRSTPSTLIRAGYNYYYRSQLYSAGTVDGSLGYRWAPTAIHYHELRLISLDYTKLHGLNAEDDQSDLVRLRFNEEFISLIRYDFTLNNLVRKRTTNYYSRVTLETAGNVALLARSLGAGQDPSDGPSTIAGVPFSNYGRISEDFRFYYNFNSDNRLVSRLWAGVGIPYGNSDRLPYKKQFFAGGVSSLRAFPVRGVGPGSYHPPDSLTAVSFLDQTGDIKLEVNLEYRFPVAGIVQGAVFADAGNVWLYRDDPDLPGGKFEYPGFIRQVALGTGLGVRLDLTIIVLRLDLAFPLRKPYLTEGERWVLDRLDFVDRAWRRENLVFNLAIGYPF